MSLADLKRKEAIDFFIRIGMFIPFDSLNLYHGRSRQQNEEGEWVVDPKFNNSWNNTGNRNFNGVSALSTGEKSVATAFAKERSRYGGTPEVHKIESLISNALIFNRNFKFEKLSATDKTKFLQHSNWLINGKISKYAPVSFEDRNRVGIVYDCVMSYDGAKGSFIDDEGIKEILLKSVERESTITEALVKEVVGAWNARLLLIKDPKLAITKFVHEKTQSDRESFEIKRENKYCKASLNLNYIASWLNTLGIVGAKSRVWSATLNNEIDAYFLFDLNSINTRSAKAQKIKEVMSNYSAIIDLLGELDTKGNTQLGVFNESSPEKIMDTLSNNEKFGECFKADAQVWEKFSVGEHTETCLRLFESGLSQEMPKQLHPYMRLAIVCHDIGKGMPSKNGENQLQKNLDYSKAFMNSMGVPTQVGQIVWIMIAAQSYTSDYYVKGDKEANHQLQMFLIKQLQKVYGISPSDEQVAGLMSMCKALQICDSGAYTRHAVTRDKKTGRYYKNGNDRFTESFEQPTNLTKDNLKFKVDPTM